METLQVLALALAVLATGTGVWAFVGGVRAIVRTVAAGGPATDRTDRRGRRTWLVVREVLGHGRFAHRRSVKVAHWVVMASFPLLFLTLVTAFGQLVDPAFVLPLVGRWLPLEWLTEAIAWAGLLGIAVLVVVRQRAHPRRGEAAAGRPSAAWAAASGGVVRRWFGPRQARASRFFASNAGQAYFVEAVIAVVLVCVLLLRGLEYAYALTAAGFAEAPGRGGAGWFGFAGTAEDPLAVLTTMNLHHPLTAWFGSAWVGADRGAIGTAIVAVALVKILVSASWLYVVGRRAAMGVAWHRFLAVVNVWARRELDGRPALGPVPPARAGGVPVDFEAIDDLPDDARLGVGQIEDFTWKGLLDFSTCTECGRCQEQCPAWNTGKPLSPKKVVMSLRDHSHAVATSPTELSERDAAPGSPGSDTSREGRSATGHAGLDVLSLVGAVVETEALWDCTMCGACVQQCPVDIEHIDHIIDMRRNQVLMESAFPDELGPMFTKLERQSNPWGLPARARLDWATDLPFEVPVIGADVEDATAVDYLFWVGCAGAYEDRAKRTTRAVAELLHIAGVSFAVLGDGESCTGDPARRAGNEFLFQMLAQANVEVLTEAKAQRIVVTCAHCFNTIAREYPQLGGRFDVVHHTELLDRLVGEGRLTPVAAGRTEPGTTVTYHDPCFLGRHNQVYTPPRELVGALPGVTLAEMPRNRERGFCCGGGGARVWMEEKTGTRISTDRAAEAIATGAQTIATACPFCTIMLTDGVAANTDAAGSEQAPVQVVDVAQLLLDSVRPQD